MTHRTAIATVAAVAAIPRLLVAANERGDLLAGLLEKSDRFATTLVESGSFGFLAGRPSANTQPLYGMFLAGLYWVFDRHWLVVALAQTLVATLTALLVLELARRVVADSAAVLGAAVATLSPYLVWHDLHLNREVLDGLLAVALTLLTLVAAERRSIPLAAAAGAVTGVAILGNARLALLPIVLAAFVVWQRRDALRPALISGGALVACAVLVTVPWLIRNERQLGCATLTTDARALWKANNLATYDILARGGWIDQVPPLPGAPPWPELAADLTLGGTPTTVDECAQMRLYQREVLDFWRDEPVEKGRLAVQAVAMFWSPVFTVESDSTDARLASIGRTVIVPVYIVALYALGAWGLFLVPRRYAALVVALLGYSTLTAMVFAGTMRYRAPWDFLLAIPAAAAMLRVTAYARARQERAT